MEIRARPKGLIFILKTRMKQEIDELHLKQKGE